jgi:uncharacterized membrane protein (DUF485 family)
MAGLDHSPPPSPPEPEQSAATVRLGRILFLFYLALYSGFVLLNAFAPRLMEETPFAGVNVAVLYGLALIFVAFFLALLYDWLCQKEARL